MITAILRLAIRNVLRNRRRTLITLFSIIVGTATLIYVGGYIEYIFKGTRETMIRSELGHFQIYKMGYSAHHATRFGSYLLSPEQQQSLTATLSHDPRIQAASKRLSLAGIISNGEQSLTFVGTGIEPEKESKISSMISIISGENLLDSDQFKIIVGEGLAQRLALKIGQSVTLLTTTLDGGMNAMDFQVAGIEKTGKKELDDMSVRLLLRDSQALLGTTSVERLVVLLDHTEDMVPAKRFLSQALDPRQFEFKTWEELGYYYFQVRTLYTSVFTFLKAIILIIVVLSIVNTMMMSVMERLSEFGTLRAMGTSKASVMSMLISEGVILGILGAVVGCVVGITLAKLTNLMGGLYMPPPPGHNRGYQIFILIIPSVMGSAVGIALCASVVSSILPALRAAKFNIVEAIRHV